jgi:Na+-translocating ferredoxin:NAD+ oxidoreductase RnfC subunit
MFPEHYAGQWALSSIHCAQILAVICVFLCHQQLYSFKKEEHKYAKWGRVFSDVDASVISHWDPL